jgi:hypothetical protein
MASPDQYEKDYIAYKTYVDLWTSENPIKTFKILTLLLVNGLLVSSLRVAPGSLITNWPIFMAGAVLSAVAVVSIGRTNLFQKVWKAKAKELSERHPGDPRFEIFDTEAAESAAPSWLRIPGAVPSKYYLLGAPVIFSLVWTVGLIYIIVANY